MSYNDSMLLYEEVDIHNQPSVGMYIPSSILQKVNKIHWMVSMRPII